MVNSPDNGSHATILAMLIHRDTFTSCPPIGDYFLSSTGLTWGVRRTNANGSVADISAGARERKRALATLLSVAEGDKADAWEVAGPAAFRLIKRYRSSPKT